MDNVAGRGKKQCKKCEKFSGVRTAICECGASFVKSDPAPVAASPTRMTLDPLDQQISESVSSVKTILQKAESGRRSFVFTEKAEKVKQESPEAVGSAELRDFKKSRGLVTYVPSGECPFKPEGFKDAKWSNGTASSETVQNWAIRVFNSGDDYNRYHPEAVVYWARYYWDMSNRVEWSRIRVLILTALTPKGSTPDLTDDDD